MDLLPVDDGQPISDQTAFGRENCTGRADARRQEDNLNDAQASYCFVRTDQPEPQGS
jgi:hypothetical protein